MERSAILEIAVEYIRDIRTLARCWNTSKRLRDRCVSHVQQYLPALLASAHEEAFNDCRHDDQYREVVHRKPLEWLYQTAGPEAVGSTETATALLCTGTSMPEVLQRPLVPLAFERGMKLTTEAVVAASKARADFTLWLDSIYPAVQHDTELQMSVTVAAPFEAVLIQSQLLKPLLPHVLPQKMPDLLHVAVNSRYDSSDISDVLEHDKQHTHVLYGDFSNSSLAGHYSRIQLAQELLTTSIIRKHTVKTEQLAATPAAQALSPAAVLQLLYLALQYGVDIANSWRPHESLEAVAAPWVAAVLQLPAARLVDAVKLGSLMHFALQLQRASSVVLLSRLPQAQQLPPKQLGELLLLAGRRAGAAAYQERDWEQQTSRDLLRCLAALPSAKQLLPGTAFKLLKLAIDQPWGGEDGLYGILQEDLSGMDLGSQLTGSELLQLLMMTADTCSGECSDLSALKPAADLVDDEAGYVAFLEQAIGRQERDVISSVAADISFTKRLCLASAVRLIQTCLSKRNGVYAWVLKIPALQQISAEAAGQLLLHAAQRGNGYDVEDLLAVPAASWLPATLLEQLLQTVLAFRRIAYHSNEYDLAVVPKVLALPAAGHMSAASVAELLILAIQRQVWEQQQQEDGQCWWVLDREQPLSVDQEQPLSAEAVTQQLLQHPAVAELAEASALQLLYAAVLADDSELLRQLCALPAMQQLNETAIRQLYLTALDQPVPHLDMLHTLQEQLPQFAAVAATVELTPEQVQKLLLHALQMDDTGALCGLLERPAAAHITPEGMQQLLQPALQLLADVNGDGMQHQLSPEDPVGGPIWVMIRSSAAEALSAAAVAELLLSCIQQESPAGAELVSLLPGAAQLRTDSCEDLLQQALQQIHKHQHSSNSIEVLQRLLQLPAVQAVPADAVTRLLQLGLELGLQLSVPKLLYSQLPAAQQLSCDDVRALMLTTLEKRNKLTFAWFRGFPKAPIDDEVQAWQVVLEMPRPA